MAFEADQLTRIKLCILFLLENVRMPLSGEQIILALEPYDWIDRFSMAQALDELVQKKMLNRESYENRERYQVTDFGKNSLNLFMHEIPISMRCEIEDGSQIVRSRAKSEAEYITDYHKIEESRYLAELKIMEDNRPVMVIKIELPTRTQAHHICENWSSVAPGIYTSLMDPILHESGK